MTCDTSENSKTDFGKRVQICCFWAYLRSNEINVSNTSVPSLQSQSGRFLCRFVHGCLHNEDSGEHQARWVFAFKPGALSSPFAVTGTLPGSVPAIYIADYVFFPGTYDMAPLGKLRTFIGYPHCRESIGLLKGKTYLIMGMSNDIYKDEQEQTWVCSTSKLLFCHYLVLCLTCKSSEQLTTRRPVSVYPPGLQVPVCARWEDLDWVLAFSGRVSDW